jgi:RimJ/RimL family protein N-acetyltransferase
MKKMILKNGKELVIRRAEKEDARGMIEYMSIIGGESDFLTFGLNEFKMTLEMEEQIIESINNKDNSIMLVGELEGQIVSIVSMNCSSRPRIRHSGEFGISVRKPYWGLGIGDAMINYLVQWANGTNIIRKINLKVRTDNSRAINLYKRHGFKEEGIITRDLYLDGVFYDSLYMGLAID